MLLTKYFLLLVFFQANLFPNPSQPKLPADVLSIVKNVVQNIKNSRDAKALSQMDIAEMSAFLLEGYDGSATNVQRTEFTKLFQSYLTKYIFTHLRSNFKDAATVYGAPEINYDKAELISTFTKPNPLKKQEIKLKFSLLKTNKGWKVIDFTYAGDRSMLGNLRDDKIRPALKKGGLEEALNELREE
jgi:phospholipid transport system substrate-binding protein